jgi:hypothetical protein
VGRDHRQVRHLPGHDVLMSTLENFLFRPFGGSEIYYILNVIS